MIWRCKCGPHAQQEYIVIIGCQDLDPELPTGSSSCGGDDCTACIRGPKLCFLHGRHVPCRMCIANRKKARKRD